MTRSETDLIRRAMRLLQKLVPDEEGAASDPTSPRTCPVTEFTRRYLVREPGTDMTSAELWTFYSEVAAAGEIESLSRVEFLRELPGAMAAVFGARKSHTVQRDGRTVRGFKSITAREDAQ